MAPGVLCHYYPISSRPGRSGFPFWGDPEDSRSGRVCQQSHQWRRVESERHPASRTRRPQSDGVPTSHTAETERIDRHHDNGMPPYAAVANELRFAHRWLRQHQSLNNTRRPDARLTSSDDSSPPTVTSEQERIRTITNGGRQCAARQRIPPITDVMDLSSLPAPGASHRTQ